MRITAAVVEETEASFELQELELEAPRADEVLVRLVACGVCHTDVVCRDGWIPVPMPVVLGHEGSGVVEQVGDAVVGLEEGDHVVLSWGGGCGRCANCLDGQPAYCDDMGRVSFGATRLDDGSVALQRDGHSVHSHFMGQSSFATHAVVGQDHAVKIDPEVPLELMGPLGCGFQTGAGAIFDALEVGPGTSVAVFGAGAVGLAAIMAAKAVSAGPIVAVDLNRERLALAYELGADMAVHPEDGDVSTAIQTLVEGGVDVALETTADPQVLRTAFESVHLRGTCALLGAAPPATELTIDAFSLLLGRTLRGIIVGDSVPAVAIPRMVELYKAGRFPIDRLVRLYELDQINEAVADSLEGRTVKPILRMPA